MLPIKNIAERAEAESNKKIYSNPEYTKNRIRNEYYFYRAVCKVNEQSGKPTAMSAAHLLHDRFLGKLDRLCETDINRANEADIIESYNAALNDRDVKKLFSQAQELTDNLLAEFEEELKSNYQDKFFAPLSPFDERFCLSEWALFGNGVLMSAPTRSAVEKNTYAGTEADTDDASDTDPETDTDFLPEYICEDDYTMEKEPDLFRVSLCNKRGKSTDKAVLTKADRCGISVMSLYLPHDNPTDLKILSSWVTESGKSAKSDRERFSSIETMLRIFEKLLETGISYTVNTETVNGEKGALKAVCGDRFSIRVMDVGNESRIGTARSNGIICAVNAFEKTDKRKFLANGSHTDKIIDYLFAKNVEGKSYFEKIKPNAQSSANQKSFALHKRLLNNQKKEISTYELALSGQGRSDLKSFESEKKAQEYIDGAVSTARRNFVDTIGMDKLVEQAENRDENFYPLFSADPQIAQLQEACWNAIRDAQEQENYSAKAMLNALGAKREQIADAYIGRFDPNGNSRFNPVLTARYMKSGSLLTKRRNTLGAALLTLKAGNDCFMGEDGSLNEFTENLIEFDDASAQSVKLLSATVPFWKRILSALCATVRCTGCAIDENEVDVDKNGILRYRAVRLMTDQLKPDNENAITGYIGQVFAPEAEERFNGISVIRTRFNKTANYLTIPGYDGMIIPQKFGKNTAYEERMRLNGYTERMERALIAAVRSDLFYPQSYLSCTKLNSVYRHQYGIRYPLDALEQFGADGKGVNPEGLTWESFAARLKSLSRRVRFDNIYRDKATVMAEQAYEKSKAAFRNDLKLSDPFVLTGFHNFAVIENNGYFSPTATSSNNSQGIVRYLCDGAEVNEDGTVTPVGKNQPAKLRETALIQEIPFHEYDTADRVQMVFSNLLTCRSIAEETCIAFTNLGQFNQNDSIVISRDFAEKHPIYPSDEQEDEAEKTDRLRPLQEGDKLCDMHGNKFTVSLVADASMEQDEELVEVGKFFKNNPEVDAVASPYSFISRFNAGSAKEIMSHPEKIGDLTIGGKTISGGRGVIKMIITTHAADKKLNVYDRSGRSFSHQLTAAMIAAGAEDVIREVKGTDSFSFTAMREHLLMLGIALDEHGNLSRGCPTDGRHIVRQPSLPENGKTEKLIEQLTEEFLEEISADGGFMEIPFDLQLSSSDYFEKDSDTTELKFYARHFDRPKSVGLPKSVDENGQPNGMYLLPLLSPLLREGREDDDDGVVNHYYTGRYESIFQESLRYRMVTEQAEKDKSQSSIRRNYEHIVEDLKKRIFHSKSGHFKALMKRRLNRSATAVWIADPRLALNEVYIPLKIAQQLNISDGQSLLIWRDPILSDGGVRYMRVKTGNRYENAVGIHPAVTKSFKGDYDGDSIGLWMPTKPASKRACQRLTIRENLLDKSFKDQNGEHVFYIDDELDMQAVLYHDSALRERYENCRKNANDPHADHEAILNELNALCREVQRKAFGINTIRFDTTPHFVQSIDEIAENGAKGSYEKADVLFRQFGISVKRKSERGRITGYVIKEPKGGNTLATEQDRLDTQYATAVKSHCTGLAGKMLQYGLKSLLDGESNGVRYAKAVMELTSGVTQSLLQIKHDPARAHLFVNYLDPSGPIKAVWNGKAVTKEDGVWKKDSKKSKNGLCPNEWEKEFIGFYTDKNGLNIKVNEDYVHLVAQALTTGEKVGSIATIQGHQSVLSEQAFDPSYSSLIRRLRACEQSDPPLTLNLYGIQSTMSDSNIAYVYAPKHCLPEGFEKTSSHSSRPVIPKWLKSATKRKQTSPGVFDNLSLSFSADAESNTLKEEK